MNGPVSFPTREEGFRLHVRLSDQEADAPADVCAAYLEPITACLSRLFPGDDSHLAQTAAHEALIAYLQRPASYDPRRLDLGAYLRMAAKYDRARLCAKEARHHRGRADWNLVDLAGPAGNSPEVGSPAQVVEEAETAEGWARFLARVTEGWDDAERAVLELLMVGERSTAAFAAALGLAGLPAAEQEREVKRAKDRVKKRLLRAGAGHG